MINLDSTTNENNKDYNKNGPYIPHYQYRIMIIGGSRSGKTNASLNLIREEHARDINKSKYQFLIKRRENAGIRHFNNPNAFIHCSNTMNDVYENNDDYSLSRKIKKLIVFDDMIADIMTNRRFQAIIKELLILCRKINISLVFITQSYFCSKTCQIKFNILFDHENKQRKTTIKYCS